MKKRQLGQSSIEVAPLMLGGNVFGWTADEATSFKILDAFVAAGLNFIDTADSYSTWVPGHQGGESETIIGNWFKRSGKRDKVVIATKVGAEIPGQGKGLSKAWIMRQVEASLKRLQTDHIDLYQSHRDDPNTPVEETLETYAQLIQQGKVRVIGCSNFTAERTKNRWRRAASMAGPDMRACNRITTCMSARLMKPRWSRWRCRKSWA